MARALVLNTSIMIAVFHDPPRWPAIERALASGATWLPAVAIAELYAGTLSPRDSQALDRLVATVSRIDRLLNPTPGEWARAGRLVSRHIRLYGDIEPRDHLADVLIAVLAARLRGTVVTLNRRHFARWVTIARQADLDVTITPATRVFS